MASFSASSSSAAKFTPNHSFHLRRTLSDAANSEPWELIVLGFSIAIFIGVVAFGVVKFYWDPCKHKVTNGGGDSMRPPKMITTESQGRTVPNNETDSVFSDVTSHGLPATTMTGNVPNHKSRLSVHKYRMESDVSSKIDAESRLMHLSERSGEDDDSGVWDYSVAGASVGGMSTRSSGSMMQTTASIGSSVPSTLNSPPSVGSTSGAFTSPKMLKTEKEEEGEKMLDANDNDVNTNSSDVEIAAIVSSVATAPATTSSRDKEKRRSGGVSVKPTSKHERRILAEF